MVGPVLQIGTPGSSRFQVDWGPRQRDQAMAWQGLKDIFGGIAQFEKNRQDREVMQSIFGERAPFAGAGPGTAGVGKLKPTRSRDETLNLIFRLHDPKKQQLALQAFQLWDKDRKATGRWLEEPDAEGRPSILRHSLTGDIKADPRATAPTGRWEPVIRDGKIVAQRNTLTGETKADPRYTAPKDDRTTAQKELDRYNQRNPDNLMTMAEWRKLDTPGTTVNVNTADEFKNRFGSSVPTGFYWTGRTLPDGSPDVRAFKGPATKVTETTQRAFDAAGRVGRNLGVLGERAGDGKSVFETLSRPDEAAAASLGVAGNYLLSQDYQRAQQAMADVASALLRLETGAAAPEFERKEVIARYSPRPGDTPEVIRQKWQALFQRYRNAEITAGPAYETAFGFQAPEEPPPLNPLVPGGAAETTAAGVSGLTTPEAPPVPAGPTADLTPGMFRVPLPGSSVGLSELTIPAAPDAPPTPAPAPNLVPGGAVPPVSDAPVVDAAGLTVPPAPTGPGGDPTATFNAMTLAQLDAVNLSELSMDALAALEEVYKRKKAEQLAGDYQAGAR